MNKAQAPERLYMAIVVSASDKRSTQWLSIFISWHRTLFGGAVIPRIPQHCGNMEGWLGDLILQIKAETLSLFYR